MTVDQIVLDTDILIHLLRKDQQTVDAFLRFIDQSTTMLLSPVVVAEVYAGAFTREYKQIEGLFSLFQLLVLDAAIARIAGQYANQFRKAFSGVSLEDYLMAATARQNRCPLWTGNRKHYPMDDIEVLKL